jgi:hypothetical protein
VANNNNNNNGNRSAGIGIYARGKWVYELYLELLAEAVFVSTTSALQLLPCLTLKRFFISQSIQFYEQETENKFDTSVTKHINDIRNYGNYLLLTFATPVIYFNTHSSLLWNGIYSHQNVSRMK